MYKPVEGGYSEVFTYGDERIVLEFPPVGYCVNRMPDPATGVPDYKVVPCEILFEDQPIEAQKWQYTPLPKEWKEWLKDEKYNQRHDPEYFHPDAEAIREREWRRRINGVWIALGNKIGEPTEYHFLTGNAYLFFQWWIVDYGHAKFRVIQNRVWHILQWADDCDRVNGTTLSTNRRFGKTAMLGCWMFELCSRAPNAYGGMQAQTRQDASTKFDINVVQPWRRLPEFFRPQYDYNSTQKSDLDFSIPIPKGKAALELFDEEDQGLNSILNYRETRSTSYDGEKLHRYGLEEPGKWIEESVKDTIEVAIPCTMRGPKIIGKIFAPTTIEELTEGGDEYIQLFERSFPSWMEKTLDHKTKSGLIAVLIPAKQGLVFDEYGRSVVNDPKPGEILLDEDGEVIEKGANTIIYEWRKRQEDSPRELAKITRKYPNTWEEAKMVDADKCIFNVTILTQRLSELNRLPENERGYTIGNFDWVGEKDGDVEFNDDELGGRFKVSFLPDMDRGAGKDQKFKIANNVDIDVYASDKFKWFPKNDARFCIGTDPIKYKKSKSVYTSKAGAYGFRKLDIGHEKKRGFYEEKEHWETYSFMFQYLIRPDEPEVYFEDMIKACRFYGCSILPEDNVTSLRQHFDSRGYGKFIMYRKDFTDDTLKLNRKEEEIGVDSNWEVIDTYCRKLIGYVNRHGKRIPFEELIEQMLKFDINDTTKFDAVVAAGFTLIAAEKIVEEVDEIVPMSSWFDEFNQSGEYSTYADEESYG